MFRPVTFTVFLAFLLTVPALAQEPDAPAALAVEAKADEDGNSVRDKASYLFGFRMMTQMKNQGAEFNLERVMEGMKLAVAGGDVGIDDEEARSIMMSFEKMARANKTKMVAKQAEDNLAAGQAFFKELETLEKIQKLDSGILYEVIKAGGTDGASPAKEDKVRVHYRGTHIDGKQFDASNGTDPAEFQVSGVIRGFTAALVAMKPGDKWKVYIPAELAYGKRGAPPRIGPNEALVFELELVEVVKQDPGN